MVKTKMSREQKIALENISKYEIDRSKLIPYSPSKELRDEKFIGKAILECLKNNDAEGVIEVISIYLNAIKPKKKKVSPTHSVVPKGFIKRNPTIKTLAKLVHSNTMQTKRRN